MPTFRALETEELLFQGGAYFASSDVLFSILKRFLLINSCAIGIDFLNCSV